ncbi:hypothetical protein, partial [Ralstonia pseudosolanacearum]|uniref:hypothetical protein n=1 Tax=Ralstonia pseudosolanacearum TaxID=1310165 RepID=UPI0020044733
MDRRVTASIQNAAGQDVSKDAVGRTQHDVAAGERIVLISASKQGDVADGVRETLINGVREWNREPSCSRFPHRGKEVPIEHVFRRFRVVPGA